LRETTIGHWVVTIYSNSDVKKYLGQVGNHASKQGIGLKPFAHFKDFLESWDEK